MTSALAIVSKAVFEKQATGTGLGGVLALDHYDSHHKSLAGLADGDALFLVTVRPPDEQLWLVAVLESPKLGKTGWVAAANRVPITDASALRNKLTFTSGTGIQAKPGALGMSLQTPRVLTDADVALLRGLTAKTPNAKTTMKPAAAITKKKASKAAAKPSTARAERSGANAAAGTSRAGTTFGSGLAALQKAFAANDGAAALTAALAWWRVERSPALADLIDQISHHVSGHPVTSQIDFAKIAAANNPLDLGRLLPAIIDMQVNFLPTVSEVLAGFPDDPRIATEFATWTMVPITTSISKTGFWSKMHVTVERIGDPRIIPALKRRLAAKQPTSEWWARYYNRLQRTIARIEKLPPAPAVDTKALAKLRVTTLRPIAETAAAKTPTVAAAPKLTGPLLVQAATHLAAGRITAAIEAIVERWRETRVPALADLVERVTLLSPFSDLPLISSGDGKVAHAAWLAAYQADPSTHLPQLLANLGVGGQSELQMSMLAGLPDDPRIAMRLAERAHMTGGNRNDRQFWNTLFQTLARHRDVRTCQHLREAFGDFENTYFYAARPAKRYMSKFALAPEKAFSSWPLVLDAADQKLFDKLVAQVDTAVTKAQTRERVLVAAIAEDWKSEGPREVYADYLIERQHPRGELILLETKRKLAATEADRHEELTELPALFGALEGFCKPNSGRERGLYREVTLSYSVNTLTWRMAASSPLAALIETVDLDDSTLPTAADFARFVAAAPRLREVKGVKRAGIEQLDPDHAKHWKADGKARMVRL